MLLFALIQMCGTGTVAAQELPPIPLIQIAPALKGGSIPFNAELSSKLRFTVKADGSVADVEILESNGPKDYRRALAAARGQWQYLPALKDGQQIDSPGVEDTETFSMRGMFPMPGRDQEPQHADVRQLLQEGKYADAKAKILADTTDPRPPLLSLLLAYAEFGLKNPDATLRAFAEMHGGITTGLVPEVAASALTIEIQAAAMRGHYGDARHAYHELDQVTGGNIADSTRKVMAQIDAILANPAAYKIPSRLTDTLWRYRPARRTITFTDIEGVLHQLAFVCDQRQASFAMQSDVEWTIPESWGECLIVVRGEPDTTFAVVEFR